MKTLFTVSTGYDYKGSIISNEDGANFEELKDAVKLFVNRCDAIMNAEFIVGTANPDFVELVAVIIEDNGDMVDAWTIIDYDRKDGLSKTEWISIFEELHTIDNNVLYHYHNKGEHEHNGKSYDRYEVRVNQ